MKRLLIAAGVVVLCIGLLLVLSLVRQGNDRRALADYKAQLRAQGEWLTIEDAGYPFALETNADLKTFTNLASQLAPSANLFARLDPMPFAGPGLMLVVWQEEIPPMVPDNRPNSGPSPEWEQLSSECNAVAPALAALRTELEHPPRHFHWDYTNLFRSNGPRLPFVLIRQTAQAFAADTVLALRADDLERARADLHALTQLTQLCRDDLTLVTCMIRVAFARLGLEVTAQSLQHEGLDEAGLAALQRDWEAVDLLHAVEQGLVGERIFGLQIFDWVRQSAPTNRSGWLFGGSSANLSLKDRVQERLTSLYWRTYMDQDELFYLQHHQGMLDILRDLEAHNNGAALAERIQAHQDEYDQILASPLGRYRYYFSAIGIANLGRAVQTAVRNETFRRMTVTAIALRRFHLREGHYPGELDELVPAFFDPVPTDLWSGIPFRYRLNPDGSYLLYSVGEDGVDDGGDCTPASAASQINFWTGKDVVWPRALPATSATPE